MKKVCILIMILVLVTSASFASAATYTLSEKMEKQLEVGSGLKGSFTVHAEGNSDLMVLLKNLNDREIQIRSISARDADEGLTTFYVDPGDESQKGLVEVCRKNGETFIRVASNPEKIYSLGNLSLLFDLMTAEKGNNIQIWSVLKKMLDIPEEEWNTVWTTALNKYYGDLELWLNQYAMSPHIYTAENGLNAIETKYSIEPDALRSGIVSLISEMLDDSNLVSLLSSKMSPEHAAIYLNKDLIWFYRDALESAELNGPVVFTRRMTTKGVAIGTEIKLPLGTNPLGFKSVSLTNENDEEKWFFEGDEVNVRIIPGKNTSNEKRLSYHASIVVTPGSRTEGFFGQYGAYDFALSCTVETSTDDEDRNHQYDRWSIELKPNPTLAGENSALYEKCTGMQLSAELHYSGKNAQTSATTLEIDSQFDYGEDQLQLKAKVKTAATWDIVLFDAPESISIFSMNEKELQTMLTEFLSMGKE